MSDKFGPMGWFATQFLPWLTYLMTSITNAIVFVLLMSVAFYWGVAFHAWNGKEEVLIELCNRVVSESKNKSEVSKALANR